MSYISHINKYTSSQAIQDALDNGTLANPYVAMTTAGTPALDYNTLEPTPPAPETMGTWTGKDFQITETGTTYWLQPVKIGELNNVYMDGKLDNLDVMLSYNSLYDVWHMEFASTMASSPAEHDFEEMEPTWDTGVMTDPADASSKIEVIFDDPDVFGFIMADGFLTPINPEYPEVGPVSETMGTWSDGQGVYAFQITETGDTYWEQGVKIGVLNDVYTTQIGETPIDMDVMLYYSGEWAIVLQADGANENPTYSFANGVSDRWYAEDVTAQPNSMEVFLIVDWDGQGNFIFQYNDTPSALSMTTINPEYPAGE